MVKAVSAAVLHGGRGLNDAGGIVKTIVVKQTF